ncbi:hypothetical protein Tco_0764951 [Tanacetum coccineum]
MLQSFTAQINRPPTPHPIIIHPQQQPILTPATTTSSSLQNLPNFASLFGFDHRLKALEDNFSELRQTNQYAEALSSIPSTVEQYLANKMQEAVDVAVQLNQKGSLQDESKSEEVQHPSGWLQKPTRLPSPDHAWNTSVPAVHESVQPWLSNLAQQDPRESFDELTDSTFDFSAFVLNRLNVQTLTPELLAGPTFELMKGTCKSLTELEYFCEEPLPLVPNYQGGRVIPLKYSTSVMKTTAADYGHIKWIEDLVPNSIWSQTIVKYDKFALWGISHWGKKRRQFYAFATLRESARDVYSKRRIIAVTKVEIVEWHDYKHLDWITVRRDDDVLDIRKRLGHPVYFTVYYSS